MNSPSGYRHAVLAVLVLLVPGVPAWAATPGQRDELDEILVQGSRARLAEMRKELVALEDRFYAQYNDLNPVKDFDIHCVQEARTGTRIVRRTCRAVYEDVAIAQEGEDGLQIRQYLQSQMGSGRPGHFQDDSSLSQPYQPPAPPLFAILARLPDFQKNLKQVVTGHPELLNLLRERAALTSQYEALRRRIFGSTKGSEPAEDASR